MSESQKPEDNPYLATQVADVPLSEGNKTPGPLTIITAILIGGVTAVVTFCVTFFFTCLGLADFGGSSSGATLTTVALIAIVTAIIVTWFAVWGFLKIVAVISSNTN
jgi:hypothetical protein